MTPEIELPDREVHAWIEPLTWTDALLSEAREMLSPAENERADRFLHKVHRNRYLISHLKLRKILGRYLASSPHQLQFDVAEFGKPFLAPSCNGARINFNLSHSNERMLLGLVRNANIGVDIEEIRPESATLEVANRFFSERENQQLRNLSSPEQIEAFFNCWTRKEAYLKAIGFGLSIDPRDCEVSLVPSTPPKLMKVPMVTGGNILWSLYDIPGPGYIAAIAVDHPCTIKRKSD